MKDDKSQKRIRPAATPSTAPPRAKLEPVIQCMPSLPAIDWSLIGQQAPRLVATPPDSLPQADVVIITWTGAEWAAMDHVFCSSGTSMPYRAQDASQRDGWQKYDKHMPAYKMPPYIDPAKESWENWNYWGYYRLVNIQNRDVLLFKSNTHLSWPGEYYLENLICHLIDEVKPQLLLSIGTAGGARLEDHLGTVNVVRAGTVYLESQPTGPWPTFANNWQASWSVIEHPDFHRLLFPIPVTGDDLESLCWQFNRFYRKEDNLSKLNANGLDWGDPMPQLHNMTEQGTPLLTTSTFVVATTSGNLADYAFVEMDDAVIAQVCLGLNTPFGFVRNISDPVQNADLSKAEQGNWGSVIYDAYGFYTSYNGALTAWAIVSAQLGSG